MKSPATHGAMTTTLFAALFLFTVAVAHAGDAKSAAMASHAGPSRWRFGASYAPIFGLETKFSGLGDFGLSLPVQPIAPGNSYEYDNGYVRVDSSGNLGGETWNWGYTNPGQFDGANSIEMNLTSSNADARARENNDIGQGVDLVAYLDMGKITLASTEARWGLRGGLHYARIDVENDSTLRSGTTILRDTYTAAPGGIIPGAPYSGSFNGPGPLLSDTPTREFSTGASQVSGSRDLDIHLATFTSGAYLEIPVAPEFQIPIKGGLSAAVASGDYDFQSNTTITGLGTVQSSGSASDTTILPGLYLGLSGIYELNESWALQVSGRYQYMDSFDLRDNGSEAILSFDSAFVLSAGLVFSF